MGAIVNMDQPCTVKHLRRVVGLVISYRDMWEKQVYYLEPLTYLINKKKGAIERNENAEKYL